MRPAALLLRGLAAVLLAASATAQGQPLPIEKTVTLKEDNAVWYVDGRQRIKSNVTITILRSCTIQARGEGAVLEVEGGLDLRAATGGNIVLDGVWVEPWPGCKELTLLNCNFRGDGGLRTAAGGPDDVDVILRSSRFEGASRLELDLTGGELSIMSCGFDGPAVLRGAVTEKHKRNSLELVILGCHGGRAPRKLGFLGGLRVEGVKDALLRNVDLAGEESVLSDCGKLVFDGNQVRSTRFEVRQSDPKSFGGTKISNTDFRCGELVLFQPATSGDPQRVKLDQCWFDGHTEEQAIKSAMLVDCERDEACGVLATFARIQEAPLGFGGRP